MPVPSPLRVVVVDDEPLMRLSLGRAIASQPDMELVGEAASADSAVELIGRLAPDVVVMDITMPGTSGLEAVRAMRLTGDDTPVVFMTGDVVAARGAEHIAHSWVLIKAVQGVRTTLDAVRRAAEPQR